MPAEPHTQYQLLHNEVNFNYTAAKFIQNITSDFNTITHTHILNPKFVKSTTHPAKH